MHRLRVALVVLALGGCAPFVGATRDPPYQGNGPGAMTLSPLVVVQSATGPLSYRSTTDGAASPRGVVGRACQSGLMLPVGLVWAAIKSGNAAYAPAYLSGGWGEGGYAEALAEARQAEPGARLVDVRADLNQRIILGIWRQQCVRVTALALR